jgi:hypothetical protein
MTRNSANIAEWLTLGVNALGFGIIVAQYRKELRHHRLELAQQMVERIDTDDLLRFAATTLDWAAGMVLVPEACRAAVADKAAIPVDLDNLRDALSIELTATNANDTVRLMYRHAFVQLFNHLKRMGILLESGALSVDDLQPLSFMAASLLDWHYGNPPERRTIFVAPMTAWYPQHTPLELVTAIARRHPWPRAGSPIVVAR